MTAEFVPAEDFRALKRLHETARDELAHVVRRAATVQAEAYAQGRDDARREALRERSHVEHRAGDGLAHLTLPDNGGAIQFHVVGPSGPRPVSGGILSPSPDFSLRIWGPPDASGSYGIHEQGGGNLTDFHMAFDLTPEGMVVHRMDLAGVRTQWDRG